jgi:hypothetical protein
MYRIRDEVGKRQEPQRVIMHNMQDSSSSRIIGCAASISPKKKQQHGWLGTPVGFGK